MSSLPDSRRRKQAQIWCRSNAQPPGLERRGNPSLALTTGIIWANHPPFLSASFLISKLNSLLWTFLCCPVLATLGVPNKPPFHLTSQAAGLARPGGSLWRVGEKEADLGPVLVPCVPLAAGPMAFFGPLACVQVGALGWLCYPPFHTAAPTGQRACACRAGRSPRSSASPWWHPGPPRRRCPRPSSH